MAQDSYPEDLLYHSEHDWARIEGDSEMATLGITWYAQDALGEVVFLELPPVGTVLKKDAPWMNFSYRSSKLKSDFKNEAEMNEMDTKYGELMSSYFVYLASIQKDIEKHPNLKKAFIDFLSDTSR